MGATGLLFRGQRELRAGRPAEALSALRRAVELSPDSPHVALHHALALFDAGQADNALLALELSAQRWPASPVFPLFRGALLAESGRLDEAAAALDAARAASPGNLLAEAYLALVAMRRGDVETPLRRLAAVGFTDNPRALAALLAEVEADLFRRFGPDTDGKPPRVADEPPDGRLRRLSATRLASLGLARLERQDPAGAWPLLLLAAEKNPSLPDVYAHLGFAAHDLGRYEQALDTLARVGSWTQMPAAVHLHRGASLYKLGRFADALESLRAAEAADALGDFTAWTQLFVARTLVALGRVVEARVHLRKLIAAEGDLALARLRQARELLGLAVPESAPDGFDVVQDGKTVTVVKPGFADALRERRPAQSTAEPPRSGRGPLERIALPDGGVGLVRRCRRGGLFGRLLGDKHLDGNRFLREIAVADALRRRGIPTPEVIGGTRREAFPGVYRAEIITREVPDSRDLAEALRALPSDGGQPLDSGHAARGTRRSALAATARLLRQIHDAGLWHPDLNAKNILIAADGSAMILDLDRAELLDELPLRDRIANLVRLYRSLHKLGLAPDPVSDADWADFYAVYAAGDAALLARAGAVMARCRRDLRRHKLWWCLAGTRRCSNRARMPAPREQEGNQHWGSGT